MSPTDLRARFNELALEGIRRDSFLSVASGSGTSGSDTQSTRSGSDASAPWARTAAGNTMRSVARRKGVTTVKTASHSISIPGTPTAASHSRGQTTHPFASSWALKTATPPVSPGHLRSQSALPTLTSTSMVNLGPVPPPKDRLRSFTPLSQEDDDDAETTPTAERTRSSTDVIIIGPIDPDSPAPMQGYSGFPARPSSQPTFHFSPSDDEDDPYLLSALQGPSHATLLRKRSMSTASSASSISLPLPYRPSTSSDTFPLLPSIPQSPVDLTRPETTNLLDPTQKEVLRRRTRKLEQLLGTTHFRSGGFEDGTTVDASRSIKRDSGREQADRRTSSTGTRLVRSRTASGPPTTKTQGGRFCVPLSSSLQRIASISTLNSDGVPVSSPSIGASSDWEDDPTEKEKRRRRQTLQKIHRYLGVVVPADLVAPSSSGLGAPLPLPAEPPVAGPIWPYEDKKQTTWKTLFTRSSGPPKLDESVWKPSAVGVGVGTRRVDARRQEPQAQASPDEHARNVKRAAKMEQLFGSPPPPALYLSRPAGTPFSPTADSPVSPNTPLVLGTRRRAKSQDSPARPRFDGIIVTTEEEIEIEILEPGPMSQSYGAVGLGIGQKQKQKRERIKSDGDAVDHAGDCHEVSEMGELSADDVQGESFKSYRRSLASLDYLTQAGNRNSLATLLQFVSQSDNLDGNDPLPTPPRSSSLTPSSHVLSSTVPADIMIPRPSAQDPETASLVSFAMSTHDPTEIAPAPPAWKRAAKLRKFFGVTYRELFDQLLEKIETGAREDLERGLLSKEEFEIVVKDLRALRDRREGLSSDLVR